MGTLLAIQVICNAAVVIGLIPVTGMPLPLLSYGGSGLMCTLLGIGIVLGISRQKGQEEPATRTRQQQKPGATADAASSAVPHAC